MTGGTPPICIKYDYGGGHLGRFRSTAAIVTTFFLLSFFFCTAPRPLQQVNRKKRITRVQMNPLYEMNVPIS